MSQLRCELAENLNISEQEMVLSHHWLPYMGNKGNAFTIVFEMSTTTKGMSCSQVARRYSISPTTAWTFMHKVRKAMESSQQQSMDGDVHVDEFVFGGSENLKQGRSYDSKKKKLIVALS